MKMIPNSITEDSSIGEIAVYKKFEESTYNWTVIHSLDLAPFNKNKRTEIDFVVLIPDVGIICIEVKSHYEIGFNGEFWYPTSIKKSPFTQARDARFALFRRVQKILPNFENVPIVHCCIFPNALFSVPLNLSIQPFEIMDRAQFDRADEPNKFCDEIKRITQLMISNDPNLPKRNFNLTAQQINKFIDFCFPIRKRRPELLEELEIKERELKKVLREQQLPVLRLVNYNSKVLIGGGAGTGKSLIGLEIARSKAAKGIRVGYVCFNRLIGKWIEYKIGQDQNPLLIGGSIHSLLFALVDVPKDQHINKQFWDELPLIVQDKLTDPSQQYEASFDYLVIDEAQDFLARPDLLDCLGLLLEGGFETGSYLMLGDFQNQVLTYHTDFELYFNKFKDNSAIWHFDENCRNYRNIGHFAMMLSQADKETYSGYMRSGGGLENWTLKPFKNEQSQIDSINTALDDVLKLGFSQDDITLLSFIAIEDSVISKLTMNSKFQFITPENFGLKGIKYSTVHAYKGMENKVIFIVDAFSHPHNFDRALFYTGITRATERVFLFCHEKGFQLINQWSS
jgi:hypothetical protein